MIREIKIVIQARCRQSEGKKSGDELSKSEEQEGEIKKKKKKKRKRVEGEIWAEPEQDDGVRATGIDWPNSDRLIGAR